MSTVPPMPIDPDLAERIEKNRAAIDGLEDTQASLLNERDELIRRAVADGASLREVAALVGLSHTQVANISRV